MYKFRQLPINIEEGYTISQRFDREGNCLGIGVFRQKSIQKMKYKQLTISSNKGYGISQSFNEIGDTIGIGSFDHRGGLHMPKGWKSKTEYTRFRTAIKSMGMCNFCGEIDFSILQQHHIFGRKFDEQTITLCANCHAKLHYYLGGRREKWYGEN